MKLYTLILINFFCCCFFPALSQSSIYFKKIYGDPNPIYDSGKSVNTLSDGYVIGAYSLSLSPYDVDVYIIKSDNIGNTVWQTKLHDTLNSNLIFSSTNKEDYFYFVGELTNNSNSSVNGFLLKSDSSGTIMWEKAIGDSVLDNGVYHIMNTSDNNLLISGWKSDTISGFWQGNLIKADTSGSVIWEKSYSGIYNSAITSTVELPNGNFVLIGRTEYVLGSGKVWYLLVDSAGILINSQSYFAGIPSISNVFQAANTIDTSLDSGYIIGGHSGVDPNLIRGLIFKTNSIGQINWYKMLAANPDGTGNIFKSEIVKVKHLIDSSFVLSGYIQTGSQQPSKMILIKLDFYGNELWRRLFLGTSGYNSYGYDLDLVSDGGFILTGRAEDSTDAQVFLVKTNCLGFTGPPIANFAVNWSGTTGTFSNLCLRADTCIYYFGDGDSVLVHLTDTIDVVHTYSNSGTWPAYLIAYACGESDTLFQPITTGLNLNEAENEKLLRISPNPADNYLLLKYKLNDNIQKASVSFYDLSGRIIRTIPLEKYPGQMELDISSMVQGCYFLELKVNDAIIGKEKLIISR